MSTRTRRTQRTLVLALLMSAAALAPLSAGEYAKADGGDVALDGYCPVAYVVMGKAVKGDSRFASEHEGKTYHFANGKAKKMFDKSPGQYPVAYDGWCATAMAMGKKIESDPSIFVVRDGTTYLFSSAKAKKMFDADPAEVVAKANEHWRTVSS